MAHAVCLEDAELRVLAERGTAIAHCPLSNFFFADKLLRVRHCRSLGVKVGPCGVCSRQQPASCCGSCACATAAAWAPRWAPLWVRCRHPSDRTVQLLYCWRLVRARCLMPVCWCAQHACHVVGLG